VATRNGWKADIIVAIDHGKFQRIKDVLLLIRLGRVRALESRGDMPGALRAIEAISYEGSHAGFVATYTARLLVITKDPRALTDVENVRDFIRQNDGELCYSSYCLAYSNYLERVLRQLPYEQAGATVLKQPSTRFVRNSLLVV
jgi:hypothetical protein